MATFKSLARWIVGDYDVYRIFAADGAAAVSRLPMGMMRFEAVTVDSVAASADDLIRAQLSYSGVGTLAFACHVEGRIVGLCFFWHGNRYRTRNYWPLADGQAKLVQIVTVPDMRGKGVARGLIEYSTACMLEQGFTRLLARVWLTNAQSQAAFIAAGWKQIAIVVRINPLRRAHPMRITFGERPTALS